MNNLFKFQDSFPLYLRSHPIYNFQCSKCNINYCGETERHLKVRAGEHNTCSHQQKKGLIKVKDLPLKITAFCQVKCVPLMILLFRIYESLKINA